MDAIGLAVPTPILLACALVLYVGVNLLRDWPLRKIPAIGHTFPILNWITVIQHLVHARNLLQEGYSRYTPCLFRVATYDGWMVVVSGTQLIEEVRNAPDDVLSLKEAHMRMMQSEYTFDLDATDEMYHVGVVRNALTRNIGPRFDDIWDEIQLAFTDEIGCGEEWKCVTSIETVQRIVSRISMRLFTDTPLCRDTEWTQLNLDYTVDVMKGSMMLNLTPKLLKPSMARMLTKIKAHRQRAIEIIGPFFDERLRQFAERGVDWEDKPNDLITWLVEACPPELRTVSLLTNRFLLLSFAALHSSSLMFLLALYRLAANPSHAEILREEVKRIVATGGWTKSSVDKMQHVDSFIRETIRVENPEITPVKRWVLKPFTFSNGVCVPAGCMLMCASSPMYIDSAFYGETADIFDPWRFVGTDQNDGDAPKSHLVTTSATLFNFGLGRHACPGRFFAACELKAMLAHVVHEFDVRFKDDAGPPAGISFATFVLPRTAELEFRKHKQ